MSIDYKTLASLVIPEEHIAVLIPLITFLDPVPTELALLGVLYPPESYFYSDGVFYAKDITQAELDALLLANPVPTATQQAVIDTANAAEALLEVPLLVKDIGAKVKGSALEIAALDITYAIGSLSAAVTQGVSSFAVVKGLPSLTKIAGNFVTAQKDALYECLIYAEVSNSSLAARERDTSAGIIIETVLDGVVTSSLQCRVPLASRAVVLPITSSVSRTVLVDLLIGTTLEFRCRLINDDIANSVRLGTALTVNIIMKEL